MVICFHRLLSESEPSAVMSIMGKTDPWCDTGFRSRDT